MSLPTDTSAPAAKPSQTEKPLLICFAHRRWREDDARVRELMTRAARDHRVIVFDDPMTDGAGAGSLEREEAGDDLLVATPHLPPRLADRTANALLRKLLDDLLAETGQPTVIWLMSPPAMAFSSHLTPATRIYDCAEDLAARPNAPATLQLLERRVLGRVDLVFAGTPEMFARQTGRHAAVRLAVNPPRGDAAAWDETWQSMQGEILALTNGSRPAVRHTRERVLDINLSEAVGA